MTPALSLERATLARLVALGASLDVEQYVAAPEQTSLAAAGDLARG